MNYILILDEVQNCQAVFIYYLLHVITEQAIEWQIDEKEWPLAFYVLKHMEFPGFIVQPGRVLQD